MSCLLGQLTDGLVGVDREYEANPGWVVEGACVKGPITFSSLCVQILRIRRAVFCYSTRTVWLFLFRFLSVLFVFSWISLVCFKRDAEVQRCPNF